MTAALRLAGQTAVPWYMSEYPGSQTHICTFGNQGTGIVVNDGVSNFSPLDFDVIWLRRPQRPFTESLDAHEEDVPFLDHMGRRYHISLCEYLWFESQQRGDIFWANGYYQATRAESKMVQLSAASRVGWRILPTVVSNDKSTVLDFVAGGPAVRKSLVTYRWKEEGSIFHGATSTVAHHEVAAAGNIHFYSEIYQRRCDKLYEVRVTFFGNEYFAFKILPPEGEDRIDLRSSHCSSDLVQPTSLTDKQYDLCRRLMRTLDLATATIEFMVDEEGREFFLEVNQAGQFLWVQRHYPDLPVLESFVHFLLGKSAEFRRAPDASRIWYEDVYSSSLFKDLCEHSGSLEPVPLYR